MKKIKAMFLAISALVMVSCSDPDYPAEGHFLSDIHRIGSIEASHVGGYILGGVEPLKCQVIFHPSYVTTRDQRSEIWAAYGDMSYSRRPDLVEKAAKISAKLIDCRLKSVDVIALDDFDASHPASSSLADLCTYTFGRVLIPEWIADGYAGRMPSIYNTGITGKLSDPEWDKALMTRGDDLSLLLDFSKGPDAPCRFRVEITDGFGLKTTCETLFNKYQK